MDDDLKYLEQVKRIVLTHIPKDKFNVFLFGSRVDENHRKGADIDIGVKGEEQLEEKIKLKIKEEIEESIVPFKVDIIDFYDASDNFKNVALKDYVLWNKVKHIKVN